MENKIYVGKIKFYNGIFGFIESELGDTFFHERGLKIDFNPEKNDKIEFQLEPSTKKQGQMQACEIVLIKKNDDNELLQESDNRRIGIVKWFDSNKGYGVIGTPEGVDYFLRKNVLQSKIISSGNVLVFYGKNENGKNIVKKCLFTFGYSDWKLAYLYSGKKDIVTIEIVKERPELLGPESHKYTEKQDVSIIKCAFNRILKQKDVLTIKELCLLSLDVLQTEYADKGYKLAIDIVATSYQNNLDKKIFLKSVFEKVNAEIKYKMLFKDNLIDIQNETSKSQIDILRELGRLDFDKIKYIAQSDKIKETVKEVFLKSTFEEANPERQYKMLFDGLIILSEEEQSEFLRKYLSELSSVDY
ncbi:MAG: cold-shock protein [Ignavibacteriaceae bacterium]